MFRNVITSTPLTSTAANGYFNNITGDSYKNDFSFISTLRALVAPRLPDGENVRLFFSETTIPKRLAEESGEIRIINMISRQFNIGVFGSNGVINIHSFSSSEPESNELQMKAVDSGFDKQFSGWHRLQKVTDFYRKSFSVSCYINTELKNVCLFVDKMTMQKLHYLQCSIFAFLPWYFDPEKGVTDIEMELINSLREKHPDKYVECITKIASQYDFRTERIRSLLKGFETRYERIEYERASQDIQAYIDEINRLNRKIGDILKEKSDKEIRLLGLNAKINDDSNGDSEIMEYFLCNDNVSLETVDDNYMDFSCMGYVEYFDEDMAKQMIDNYRSYVYRPTSNRDYSKIIPVEDMKRLMYAIFIDQTIKMRFCAAYRLKLRGEVQALCSHDYGCEFSTCTPNAHIDRYSCMGNYQRTINELLKNNNYIGAIEQCIASCRSLNFADSVVMTEFMMRLYEVSSSHVNIKCIELPDGSVVKPKDAIKWLKEQEETNE